MELQTDQHDDLNKKSLDKAMTGDSKTVGSIPKRGSGNRRILWGGIFVVVVACLAVGCFTLSHKDRFNENKNINGNEFQAIFLTNGQVYFGKLADLNNKYVTIKDIYYLQVQQNSNLQGASGSTTPNSQVSLAKLGNELHGPEDKMYIANDQMLFWENLKGDSKVVQAIDKYQAQH